jgi:hypothetical protein
VDAAGDVYVTDTGNNRVVKLAAGSSTPTVLPFEGLDVPKGVAVDTAGTVYVVNDVDGQILKLAAGSSAQTVLPKTGRGGSPSGGGGHGRQRLHQRRPPTDAVGAPVTWQGWRPGLTPGPRCRPPATSST